MGMNDAVLDWFHSHPFDDVDESEARAVVDSMALAVFADGEINDDEEIEINELVSEMRWSWAEDLLADDYVKTSLAKAQEIVASNDLAAAAKSIAERLDDGRYHYLFEMLARIIASDGTVEDSEKSFLMVVASEFEISEATADDIIDVAKQQVAGV